MSWLGRWFGRRDVATAGVLADDQAVQREFMDPDHSRASFVHRASFVRPDTLVVDPGKVRSNLALAIERVDLDIDTPISLEQDVISLDELALLVQVGMGAVLITDAVNTAVRVMLARYPEALVRQSLPSQYDLRKLYPVSYTDDEHTRAVGIFNRRTGREGDLEAGGVGDLLEGLDEPEVIQVFTAVFFISMSRVAALKSRTGID